MLNILLPLNIYYYENNKDRSIKVQFIILCKCYIMLNILQVPSPDHPCVGTIFPDHNE